MNDVHSTHAVVHLGISAPDSHTLPVLVELDDPEHPTISLSVAKFARYLQRERLYSYEKIQKMVGSVGKLRDFYVLVCRAESVPDGGFKSLIEDFLFAYDRGTELGWRPASNQEYIQTRAAVIEYLKFVFDNANTTWPERELRFIADCRASWQSAEHAEKSLLFHTQKRDHKKSKGRKRVAKGLRHFKPFPPHLVVPLIENTKNVRDKLLFSLMAYGGRRLSEMLQLFVSDVDTRNDKLSVKLRHPDISPMAWMNQAGKQVKGTRSEYLKTIFGALPRTDHGAKPSAVGWKGVKFDDEATMTSDVYFIRDVEQYLLHLHRQYLYDVRASVPRLQHPYYFVSADGNPLKIQAVEKQFKLACRRLEKRYGISLEGYTAHSLRHYYGFYCADVLKADLLMIQKWIGHMQPSSTAIYAHISPETAHAVLARAEKRAKVEGRIALPTAEREAIAREFAEHGIDPLPEAWRLGSTIHGVLDTTKLRRPTR